MSDTTLAKLEDAIAEHFADENGGAITSGWFIIIKGKRLSATDDDIAAQITRYTMDNPEHMAYDEVLGLARYGVLAIENDFDARDVGDD